jgi:DNA/RNA-binding domain of Phe-tRNA-synthetase-like protein
MKKFRIEKEFLDIFPEARLGILVCHGIDNRIKEQDKYAVYLKDSVSLAARHIENPEFTENPVIRRWRDAFYKFKTKKGARCSIEALLKRVSKGGEIGPINPLVDIYNGLSLKYGIPVGGEDIDKFEGNVRLTLASGDEEFMTLGSEKSEPPSPGEIVYKDDAGAICRCFNWREAVRTMLTEETTNAFMCIETLSKEELPVLEEALEELKNLIEKELSGTCEKYIVSAESPEIVISN